MAMRSMQDEAATPSGEWAHSFEEDEGVFEVYRPLASYEFPPARRGREQLRLGSGGKLIAQQVPGPDDRLRSARCVPLGDNRFRLGVSGEGPERIVEVVDVEADRLTLRTVG